MGMKMDMSIFRLRTRAARNKKNRQLEMCLKRMLRRYRRAVPTNLSGQFSGSTHNGRGFRALSSMHFRYISRTN